jgi:ATP-dependent DNA helicase Q1
MGHDFRPDYKQLSILKTLFPGQCRIIITLLGWLLTVGPQMSADTPIVALTATCPPRVMVDVLKILKLGPITNADKAKPTGTVLFT